MLFLACSIFSSKTSQSATTRAGVFFAIIVETNVPRLPVPITPTVIAEFAGGPAQDAAAAREAPIMFRRARYHTGSIDSSPDALNNVSCNSSS